MMLKQRPLSITLFCLAALILAGQACAFPVQPNEQDLLALEQTKVSLYTTQTALAQPAQSNPPPQEQPVNPPPAEPTTPPVQVDPALVHINVEGVTFSFDKAIAPSVSSTTIYQQYIGPESFPGENYPTHLQFDFLDYALQNTFHDPTMRIYPVAEFMSVDLAAEEAIRKLQESLLSMPSCGAFQHIAFLPVWNAGQVFTAQCKTINFVNGQGIRYLTMFAQASYPIDNQNLFYTYQGLTQDGSQYVSAIFPIANPALPDDGSTSISDWDAFYEFYESYLSQAVMQLNEYPTQTFNPTIDMLDALVQSLQINR